MEAKEISVLHIDTEKTWRGGQQQAVYLHGGLLAKRIHSEFVCQPGSEAKNYFESKNMPFIPIAMRNEIDIVAAKKISKICKSRNIKILQAHSAHALSIGLLVKFFCKSIKLVGVRRVDFSINKNFLSRLKYNSRLIDKHVCISQKIKNVLLNDGLDQKKLIVIRSGVDLNKFRDAVSNRNLKSEIGISGDTFVIGTVASIVGHKDYPNLINTAKIVCDKFSNVVFVAVGGGELRDQMERLVESNKLNGKFIFAGYRKDVADFYNMFDLFVLASKKEGLGTSVIDALAFGIPVVATSAGGIAEIITDNINGKLVPPQNPAALADAIVKVIENVELRKKLIEGSKERINEFSIDHTIGQYIKLYEKLLSS